MTAADKTAVSEPASSATRPGEQGEEEQVHAEHRSRDRKAERTSNQFADQLIEKQQ
jgi:hypothetical protein